MKKSNLYHIRKCLTKDCIVKQEQPRCTYKSNVIIFLTFYCLIRIYFWPDIHHKNCLDYCTAHYARLFLHEWFVMTDGHDFNILLPFFSMNEVYVWHYHMILTKIFIYARLRLVHRINWYNQSSLFIFS
jgi:hypothetical protein